MAVGDPLVLGGAVVVGGRVVGGRVVGGRVVCGRRLEVAAGPDVPDDEQAPSSEPAAAPATMPPARRMKSRRPRAVAVLPCKELLDGGFAPEQVESIVGLDVTLGWFLAVSVQYC